MREALSRRYVTINMLTTIKSTIPYSIFPGNPEAHLFEVRCTVADPDPVGQKFSPPT